MKHIKPLGATIVQQKHKVFGKKIYGYDLFLHS